MQVSGRDLLSQHDRGVPGLPEWAVGAGLQGAMHLPRPWNRHLLQHCRHLLLRTRLDRTALSAAAPTHHYSNNKEDYNNEDNENQ